jgi:DNA-binding transcriptional LysR family regulator
MTLRQLQYVVAIAEKTTMSEAAESLFISQPSLSAAVKDLEAEMNITIFNRTNKGIGISKEGDEFLGYARQVLEQAELLENRYKKTDLRTQRFSVSTQHYSFAVNAFVDVIKSYQGSRYDFILRETQTNEIIEDVRLLKSEIGLLYLCSTNEKIIRKLIVSNGLKYTELFTAAPHVFISSKHPLAKCSTITLEQLEEYPYLSFEQGDYNSFYFSEEILSTIGRRKNIKVRDRATLFNLVIGLNGYTVSTGIISRELNGAEIIARPLSVHEYMTIIAIKQSSIPLSSFGERYMTALKKHIG